MAFVVPLLLLACRSLGQSSSSTDDTSEAVQAGVDILIESASGVVAADDTLIREKCGPVYDTAKEEAMQLLGMAVGQAQQALRDHCAPFGAEVCKSKNECTFCEGNSTCWPAIDQDNPCHKIAVDAIIFGRTAGEAIATKIGEGAQYVAAKCPSMTENATCATGFNAYFCNWCAETTSCHIKGSLADQCTRDALIDIGVEAGSQAAQAAADKAKKEAEQFYASQQSNCASLTSTNCSSDVTCIPCARAETSTACYFIGDTQNPCVKERIGQFVDAAGHLKPVGVWFDNKWKDTQAWAEQLCGKHNGVGNETSNEAACYDDQKCYWCADNKRCYIYGDQYSPCSTFAQGKENAKKKWNELWGTDSNCDSAKISAFETMQAASQQAQDNLAIVCKIFAESEVYATRTMAGLHSDLMEAAGAASEVAGVQAAKARQALIDTARTINASLEANATMSVFAELNPCVVIETSAATTGNLLAVRALALMFVMLAIMLVVSAPSF
jgi:hypothetical protein